MIINKQTIVKKLDSFFHDYPQLHYKKNETIIRASEEPHGVYYLLKGYVKLSTIDISGRELTFNIFKPYSYFPMLWAIADIPNAYRFTTLTPTLVIRAPKKHLLSFLTNHPDLLYELSYRLLIGMNSLLIRLANITFASASDRVCLALVLSAYRFGEKQKSKIKITIPLTQYEIATIAGLSREKTSKELQHLIKDSIIHYEKRTLIIDQLSLLEKRALILVHKPDYPYQVA